MQVALRKRNFDAMLGQLGLKRPEVGGAGTSGTSGSLAIDPDQQQEIEATVTEFHEPDVGFAALHIF